jgi:cyclohexadieny/prephenate dehydrogenase
MSLFERIAIVGLGLLGGSLGLGAKSRGVVGRVVGATRQVEARERALRSGAVDEVLRLEEVARGAELVVLATPIHAMPGVLERMLPGIEDGAIVTDVGSVKGSVVDTLTGLLPDGVHYVGSHPMAGSHERGMGAARADLFEGAPCVVSGCGDAAADERVIAFWRGLGAHVVLRDAVRHDAEVAWTSHLPHLLAFAFAHAFGGAPKTAHEVAGSGFRDFTRIAQSDPELWADILTANRKALAAPLGALSESLAAMARAVESADGESLEALLASARTNLFRASLPPTAGETSHSKNPSSPIEGETQPGDRSTPHE